MNIKLSILVPTYNFKKGLEEILKCINSMGEKHKNLVEIIICDDSEKTFI